MRPAFSVILLTTLIGAGQGLFLAVYVAQLAVPPAAPRELVALACVVAGALTAGGLIASFFHLGRPARAWRSASQWRTSWLSREVIALPAFLACVLLYAAGTALGWPTAWAIGAAALLTCLALFLCTGMVYACIRFLQEWASPLTLVNFFLLGAASGTTLAAVLAWRFEPRPYMLAAILLTTAGLVSRMWSLARNDRLRPKSSLQSAIGVKHPHIEQKAQGFMGGSFNTREFFHGAAVGTLRLVRRGFVLLAFVLPVALIAAALFTASYALLLVAFAAQCAGLLAERWYFFAQANHPQNLYYQAIS
jgi:DMSO reductase anchor subunit